jgi:hypothetical protein
MELLEERAEVHVKQYYDIRKDQCQSKVTTKHYRVCARVQISTKLHVLFMGNACGYASVDVLFMIALNQLQPSDCFRNLDALIIFESQFYCSLFDVHLRGCAFPSDAKNNMTRFPLLQTGATCRNPHRQTGAIRK